MIASHYYPGRLTLPILLLFCIQARYSCESYVISPPMPCIHHNNYFSASLELPLPTPMIADSGESTASSRIPVLYTNDPAHLRRWLAKNIPADGCCSIGFDIEVSSCPWLHLVLGEKQCRKEETILTRRGNNQIVSKEKYHNHSYILRASSRNHASWLSPIDLPRAMILYQLL